MKKAQEIISSLQSQPQFRKLRSSRCIEKVLSMFLPTVRRFVEFGYIKNGTLFVVLNHGAGKQEFDNSIKMIKDVLKSVSIEECSDVHFSDIKAFVTHKPRRRRKEAIQTGTIPMYEERSKGEFDTTIIHDEELRAVAEEIKEIIKRHAK